MSGILRTLASGWNSTTSDYRSKTTDWVLMHSEIFETREGARARETAIKKKKSRKYIEWVISSAG